jgi:hypothetical protein
VSVRRGVRWRGIDRRIRELFSSTEGTSAGRRYEILAGYFTLGFLEYRMEPGSLARYPGEPSTNGPHCDRMEGFARIAPLLAAWSAGGRGEEIPLPGAEGAARPIDLLHEGIEAGTDPDGPGYWGEIRDRRQQLVEAADIALAVWLARDSLWARISPLARDRLLRWLYPGVDRDVMDNNWHLFPVLIWAVLRALGRSALPDAAATAHYERFRSFHLGEGWFRDGPEGAVDYYNAWQMHYALHWLGEILPSFDRAFREEAMERFLRSYGHLMGPAGFPILGRSVCYRIAAPAPLVAGALSRSPGVSPGMARRALDRTWMHFIARGGVERGLVTQGYGRPDPRFLDAYSGPASPLWSLRSLVLALSVPRDAPFWTAPEEPLPVERESFERLIPAVGWRIRGDRETGDVTIFRSTGSDPGLVPVRGYPLWRRTLDRARGRPSRPGNDALKFGLNRYGAREPFCGYGPRGLPRAFLASGCSSTQIV